MTKWAAIIIFWVLAFTQKFIRLPYDIQYKKSPSPFKVNQFDLQEYFLIYFFSAGLLFSPLLWGITPWFDFANYQLNGWQYAIGILLIFFSFWLFWRSHIELGRYFSPSLQIREDHQLIKSGVYRYIRHPMYATGFLFVIGQLLILPNWLIGPMGLICYLPLYIIRVPKEEAMLIKEFGDAYRDYMKQTGRILPNLLKKKN